MIRQRRRCNIMDNNGGNIMKGLGIGIITGMVAGFYGSQMLKNDRKLRKKAGKALDSVGDLVDNVQNMIN